MGAVQRLSSEAQLAMTAKNGLISLVFVALYLCISCQPCQGDDDQQAKDLFKRETRKSFLSYFWPSYNRRAAEEPYWWYHGKRAPGSEFLGKRAPGSEFLGKRLSLGSDQDVYLQGFPEHRDLQDELLKVRKRSPEFPSDSIQSDRDISWKKTHGNMMTAGISANRRG